MQTNDRMGPTEARMHQAISDCLRWWPALDGRLIADVQGRRLTPEQAREAAISYDTARTVKNFGAPDGASLRIITDAANRIAAPEGLTLRARAALLLTEVEAAAAALPPMRGRAAGRPVAALSKLAMAAGTLNWVPMDSFNRRGAGCPENGKNVDVAVLFYRKLSAAGFDQTVVLLRRMLRDLDMEPRLAERLIDFALSNLGGWPGVMNQRPPAWPDPEQARRLTAEATPVLHEFVERARRAGD